VPRHVHAPSLARVFGRARPALGARQLTFAQTHVIAPVPEGG
jgi:hypothetical protein